MQSIRKYFAMAAAVVATNFLLAPAFAGGAQDSCTNWRASGGGPQGGPNQAEADCRRANGSINHSVAWLPAYLANWSGNLNVSGNGYFDRSCTGVAVYTVGKTPYFSAFCYDPSHIKHYTVINLNFLSNQNGNLGW
ncbi:MAG: CVNH domain-containing protein [Burkholderiaceae bacterium]